MYFKQIFEKKLAQYAYLIGCQATREAVIVDPMRDIDRYIKIAAAENLKIVAAAETHIHADYLTGLREFAERGVKIYASDEGDENWKYEWLTGSSYDYRLLKDGDVFNTGNIKFTTVASPGHTPEHISFLVTDTPAGDEPMGILSGDFIFVGDVGRPDLLETAAGVKGAMESSARVMYRSLQKFKSMPEYLQVWPGHGAGSACGKALGSVPETTVGYELRFNASIRAADDEQHFVDYILDGQPEPPVYFARMKRDNKKGPAILGVLPEPQKLPVRAFLKEAGQDNSVILDTRDAASFMKAHLEGALLAPLNKQFNTVAGSYVSEDQDIYLVVDESSVEEAVVDLIRIGLDHIKGYITPAELEEYFAGGGEHCEIAVIDFKQVANLKDKDDYRILDVRKQSEFQEKNISGAINIAHTRLKKRTDELPQDQTLLVHCKASSRAAVAAAFLKREGFEVQFVDDKIERWPVHQPAQSS